MDPLWPINYPAVVTQDVVPEGDLAQYFLKVATGDEVKVVTRFDGRGNVCIQYPKNDDGSAGLIGYVHKDDINIGTERRIGDPLAINIDTPHMPRLTDTIKGDNGGLLFRTIVALLECYYEHREDYPTIPHWIEKNLNTARKRENFAKRIISGVQAVSNTLYDKLNSGKFDMADIKQYSHFGDSDDHTGIYLILYSTFLGQPNRQPELYNGSTGQSFRDRWRGHVPKQSEGKGVHYGAAAKSTSRDMMSICYLTNLEPDHADLKVTEQVFQDLLQTTCEEVLNYQVYHNVDEDDTPIAASSTVAANSEQLSKVAKFIVAKEQASVMLKLATDVFERTSWPGGVRRTATNIKPFGAAAGLNWNCPLAEMRMTRTTWIKTSKPGKFANFRRSGLTVYDDGGVRMIWLKKRVGGGEFKFFLAKDEPGPAIGTKCHVVFEVNLDDEVHPARLSRAPTVGCFEDWADACKIAMRVEWQDSSGQWLYRYIQLDKAAGSVPQGPSEATTGYVLATGLKAFLLHERRHVTTEWPWLWDFGYARIKEVYVDHLTQSICIRGFHRPHPVAPMARKTLDTIGRELLALGASTFTEDDDDGFPPAGAPRTRCDWCRVNMIVGGHGVNDRRFSCPKVKNHNRCEQCNRFRRPCSFTPDDLLRNNLLLQEASMVANKDRSGVQPVSERWMAEY